MGLIFKDCPGWGANPGLLFVCFFFIIALPESRSGTPNSYYIN
jgi:hypothetical protein